jgi:uncharacterized membrane protein YgcG
LASGPGLLFAVFGLFLTVSYSLPDISAADRTCRSEYRRDLLPPNTTVDEARAAFEREKGAQLQQPAVTDEDGYVLSPRLRAMPLSTFSNKCQLNLRFAHDSGMVNTLTEPVERGMNETKEGTTIIFQGFKSVWDRVLGRPGGGGNGGGNGGNGGGNGGDGGDDGGVAY